MTRTFGYVLSGFIALALALPAFASDYASVEVKAAHLGGTTVGFNVILPHDYATSQRRYPVLYLLHGYTDHYPAWVSYTNLVDYARGYQEIIVMPEGDNGFYTNSATDPQLAWTFHGWIWGYEAGAKVSAHVCRGGQLEWRLGRCRVVRDS